MASSHNAPNQLSNHSFNNNSTGYGYYNASNTPSPPNSTLQRYLGSGSRAPQNEQENVSMETLNYPGSRTSAEREQVLRQAEAENSRLRQQLVLLETEKLNRNNQEKFNAPPKKARGTNVIRHLAHGFAISTFLWIQEKASVISKATISPNFDAGTRYSYNPANAEASKAHQLDIFLWELDQYLPAEFKHYQKDEGIMEKFLSQMQSCRSDLQHLVRNNAASLLSEFEQLLPSDAEDVLDPARRASNTRFKELLAFDPKPPVGQVSYPLVAPVIDKGGQGGLFKTDSIRKFFVILLFGKAQLSTTSGIPVIAKTSNAANWKITAVTPNMVAIAATMLRYMLSPDRAFTAVGASSHIDWLSQYSQYKRHLIRDEQTPAIASLLKNLNAQLFGGQRPRPQRPTLLLEDSIPTEDDSLQLAFASIHAMSAIQHTPPPFSSASASTSSSSHPPSTINQANSPITQVFSYSPSTAVSPTAQVFGFPSSTTPLPVAHSGHSGPPSLARSSYHQEPIARIEQLVSHATPQTLPINLFSMGGEFEGEGMVGQEDDDDEIMASLEDALSRPDQPIEHQGVPTSSNPSAPAPTSTNNLDLLVAAATATEAQPPTQSATGRAARVGAKRTYEDLDENGELEPETPKAKKNHGNGKKDGKGVGPFGGLTLVPAGEGTEAEAGAEAGAGAGVGANKAGKAIPTPQEHAPNHFALFSARIPSQRRRFRSWIPFTHFARITRCDLSCTSTT